MRWQIHPLFRQTMGFAMTSQNCHVGRASQPLNFQTAWEGRPTKLSKLFTREPHVGRGSENSVLPKTHLVRREVDPEQITIVGDFLADAASEFLGGALSFDHQNRSAS